MSGDHNSDVSQNADRIIEWLLGHRTEFESNGVEEQSLAAAVGLSEDKIREAIDYLENHEDVARLPEGSSTPPRFLLKPARGWAEIVKTRSGEKSASGRI
jgi:hypothetical protein